MENDERVNQALLAIPGLDAGFGLKSVRGRLSSYLRLFGKFTEAHEADFERIRQTLDLGEVEEARRLAHSMKGAAGALGATAVQQAAAELENAIRNGQQRPAVDPLIAELARQYKALQDATRPCLNAAQPETADNAAIRLRPLLARLRELLSLGDMRVQALVREQQTTLVTLFGPELKRFDDLIADFDFENALDMLDRYQSELVAKGS